MRRKRAWSSLRLKLPSSIMTASASTSYMHAAVAFNKVAGTLSLQSDETVRWVPSSSSSFAPGFDLRFADVAGLQTSKAGAAQIALMLVLANGVQVAAKPKILLVFNNPTQDKALHDREKFKTELAAAVGRNRAQVDTAAGTPTPSSPGPATPKTHSRQSDPSSPASAALPVPVPAKKAGPPPKTDLELRISVIKSNPPLRALHKDIVISSQQMTDAEFWAHPSRQRLLRAERVKAEQRAGRNARLADPKPTPNEAGEVKLSITPELIRDLFEQFPVVARAYEENVPNNLDEGAFWTRYFQSKLYHRLRTSARSAASEHVVSEDKIFDPYLTEEDNGLEPRRQYNPHDKLLDLQATEEDHGETGNEKDWTMRAGAERRTLPLMRRFNDHSQSLLDSALGDQQDADARKKRRIVGGVGEEYPAGNTVPVSVQNETSGNPPLLGVSDGESDDDEEANDAVDWIKNQYYRDIVIDDLNETVKPTPSRLNMSHFEESLFSNNTALDQGTIPSSRGGVRARAVPAKRRRTASYDDDQSPPPQDMGHYVDLVQDFNGRVLNSQVALGTFAPDKTQSVRSMTGMLGNLQSRSTMARNANATGDIGSLPDAMQKALLMLQGTTTEFLRQFWDAVAPTLESFDNQIAALDADTHANHDNNNNNDNDDDEDDTDAVRKAAITHRQSIRVRKMAANLAKFTQNVESLLDSHISLTNDNNDVEHAVTTLLQPTQQAVTRALAIATRKKLL